MKIYFLSNDVEKHVGSLRCKRILSKEIQQERQIVSDKT